MVIAHNNSGRRKAGLHGGTSSRQTRHGQQVRGSRNAKCVLETESDVSAFGVAHTHDEVSVAGSRSLTTDSVDHSRVKVEIV